MPFILKDDVAGPVRKVLLVAGQTSFFASNISIAPALLATSTRLVNVLGGPLVPTGGGVELPPPHPVCETTAKTETRRMTDKDMRFNDYLP